MAARAATWFAIVVGGTGGTLAALSGSSGAPIATAKHPLAPVTTQSQAPAPIASAPAATASPALSAPDNGASAAASGGAPASATADAATAPPAKTSAPLPAAELLPLPTTKQSLLRAEMRCDQRKADSCIVAARSYEGGSAGLTDPEKAAKYRKIALTAWISQCDHNSAAACATLASMYRSGSGVPQSDRNADALIERARELCRFNDAPACHELPPR